MFQNFQIGIIIEAVQPEKNFYRLKLVDSGGVVTAVPLQQSRGAATRFAPDDHVAVGFAAGAWLIVGLVPIYSADQNTSPRLESLAPGDAFYGNAQTGAGFHMTGGLPSVEASGFDASGKPRRAAGTYWIPDYDAIRNLCRRFEVNAAPGNFQMLHDDLTGRTAFRLWIRDSSLPNFDGKTARIQMGYHKDPIGAVFSIFTYPKGPDPTAGVMAPDFKMDPEAEKQEFGGQWPKIERKDWNSRYYVMLDGTAIYENALVPTPTITPTTEAQVAVKTIIAPEGFITTTAKSTVSLDAFSNLINLKTIYELNAKTFALIKAPLVTLNATAVKLGQPTSAIPLANENFFNYFIGEFFDYITTHTHPVSGSVTGPPIQPMPFPDPVTSITKNTTAS